MIYNTQNISEGVDWKQDGKSLGLIGKHLGHKSSASTERYSHLSAEETLETGAAVSKKLYG